MKIKKVWNGGDQDLTPLETKVRTDFETMQASTMVLDPKLYEEMIQLIQEVYLLVNDKEISQKAKSILQKHYNP